MSEEAVEDGLLRDLLKKVPLGMALIDAAGRVLWSSPTFTPAVRGPPAAPSPTILELMEKHGAWPEVVVKALCTSLEQGNGTSLRAIKMHDPEGHGALFMDLDLIPLERRAPGPQTFLLTQRDVTGNEEERELSFLLKEYFRTSPYPIQLMDHRHVMLAVNPALCRAYGYSKEELVGRRSIMFRSEEVPAPFYTTMWDELHRSPFGTWSGETITRRKDGVGLPEFLNLVSIKNDQGEITHYMATVVNIAELKKWEQRAAQSEKLSSIGQLAAGVAHEINSPLANAMLIVESLRRKSPDDWVRGRLDTLSEQLEAAARIIRGLLDFARVSNLKLADLDLISAVAEAVAFLRGKVSSDIEIQENYPAEAVPVTGDRLQLIQVMTNVLNNACDAMEGRGTIQVTIRVREHRAEVDIVDHGPGIPEETLPLVFDPFFTTKPEGKGTGLGLAISHGIMQSHHGSITVRNVPGGGAGVLIAMPLREGGAAVVASPPAGSPKEGRAL